MKNNKRMFLYEKLYMDENGNKVHDHHLYKDMMIFFKLIEKDYFGGRVMVTKTHVKKEPGKKTVGSIMHEAS
jgi:hypothetical protein